MILSLAAVLSALFLVSAIAWLGLSVTHLVGPAAALSEWCSGVFELCLSSSSMFISILIWAGPAALGGGLIYALVKGGLSLFKSYRAIGRLPVADRGLGVVLIRDASVRVAFTHGLIRPRIYISTGLLASLTRQEARRVMYHELHHKKMRDPLRFFLATMLRDTFFYLPIGGYITGRLHSVKERAADDAAVRRTGDPFVFAETLLKVAAFGASMRLDTPRAASIMGSGSLESRIRRLIDGKDARKQRPGVRVVLTSVAFAAVLLFSASLPLLASTHDAGDCDMDKCSTHAVSPAHAASPAHLTGDHCADKMIFE